MSENKTLANLMEAFCPENLRANRKYTAYAKKQSKRENSMQPSCSEQLPTLKLSTL